MDEYAATFDVTEEFVAEAFALARALDESRHVAHDVRAVTGHDDAQVRHERREGIVTDLRTRSTDDGDQCRLAHTRVPDDADIGDELEIKLEPSLLARLAELREVGALA